jgi:hypothetical protein
MLALPGHACSSADHIELPQWMTSDRLCNQFHLFNSVIEA